MVKHTKCYKLENRGGSFLAAKKHIAAQATRTMVCLLKKTRSLLLPIDIQNDLFEKTVKPILLYGWEVIGTGNINILEQVQLKCLKLILKRNRRLIVWFMARQESCHLN